MGNRYTEKSNKEEQAPNQEDLLLEIAGLRTKIESVEKEMKTEHLKHTQHIDDLNTRVVNLEHNIKKPIRDPFNPDVTLIATGVRFTEGEDLLAKTQRLVHIGLASPDTRVIRAIRTPWRNNRPGIVKMELDSVVEKIKLLRKKTTLSEVPEFSKVYLRSCKSHEERLIEQNIREVINMLPHSQEYRFTGSGRLIWRAAAGGETGGGGFRDEDNPGRRLPGGAGGGRGRGNNPHRQANSVPGDGDVGQIGN